MYTIYIAHLPAPFSAISIGYILPQCIEEIFAETTCIYICLVALACYVVQGNAN